MSNKKLRINKRFRLDFSGRRGTGQWSSFFTVDANEDLR
jgi:hypothetical protein